MRPDETPHPPATAEFGHVEAGGPPHAYPPAGPVGVRKLAVGPWDNNVYLIESSGEAIVVDAAGEAERILDLLEGRRAVAIVQTHNHPDHTGALEELTRALRVPAYAHPDDPMPAPTEAIADGQAIRVGGEELRALHTPGHTPGSTCYLIGDHLFAGDTLFPAGPGNTDGDAGRFRQIMASLERLFELPDETRVSPGHGLDTTIGRERPHVATWRRRGW